jgi:hypothetical protein
MIRRGAGIHARQRLTPSLGLVNNKLQLLPQLRRHFDAKSPPSAAPAGCFRPDRVSICLPPLTMIKMFLTPTISFASISQ